MSRARKFYLENAAGERMDLNGEARIYLVDPTGLGITVARSYADLGNGFFTPITSQSMPQQQPGGTLVFTGSQPYADYRRFINWTMSSQDLVLVYLSYGSVEYYRKIDVNYMSKGELTRVGWLEVPVSFATRTPWYRAKPTKLTITNTKNKEHRYPYRYTSDLIYGGSSGSTFSAAINSGGHVPAALELQYSGSILNPRITLRGEISGDIYGICQINASISTRETLEFSTLVQNSYVRKRSASGEITDLLHTVDLSYEPFFKIPITEPSVLEMEADTSLSGVATLQVYYYFGSV